MCVVGIGDSVVNDLGGLIEGGESLTYISGVAGKLQTIEITAGEGVEVGGSLHFLALFLLFACLLAGIDDCRIVLSPMMAGAEKGGNERGGQQEGHWDGKEKGLRLNWICFFVLHSLLGGLKWWQVYEKGVNQG